MFLFITLHDILQLVENDKKLQFFFSNFVFTDFD
jgi:hypothetical protein